MNSGDTLEVKTLPVLTDWAAHTENALTPSSAAGSRSAKIVLADLFYFLFMPQIPQENTPVIY